MKKAWREHGVELLTAVATGLLAEVFMDSGDGGKKGKKKKKKH